MSKFGQNWLIFARYKLQNLLQLVLKYIPCKWSLNEVIPKSFHTTKHISDYMFISFLILFIFYFDNSIYRLDLPDLPQQAAIH